MNKSTSIYLDLVRLLAAGTVFAVHANYDRFTGGLPIFWRLSSLGNDAVMVFFVLSGFVIAYVSHQKEKTVKEYFASRFARLYSVAAPALLLTVVLDFIGSRINYAIYDGWWFQADHPVWRLLANFFFVNELWFSSIRPFSNGPFWSLGYEFWYYALFAAAYYLKGPRQYFLIAAIGLLVGPKILMLFPIWLLGVWVYWRTLKSPASLPSGLLMFFGSAAAYLVFRQGGFPQSLLDWTLGQLGSKFVDDDLAWSKEFLSSYILGALVAVHLIGAATVAPRLSLLLERFETPIRYLAGYTFAIYLLHYPLLQFFAALATPIAGQSLRAAIVLCGTVLGVWAVGTVTERRKGDLRRWLLAVYETAARKLAPANKG